MRSRLLVATAAVTMLAACAPATTPAPTSAPTPASAPALTSTTPAVAPTPPTSVSPTQPPAATPTVAAAPPTDAPPPGAVAGALSPVDCAVATCIALTYDDGPSPLTPRLLDIFEARGARATLFMLGNAAQAYPDTVRRAYADGFEIANHSYSHPMLGTLADARVSDELARTNQVLASLTGRAPTLMRPPYASRTARTDQLAGQQGLGVVLWSNSPEDWVKANYSAEAVTRLTLQRATRNGIILMHDIHPWTVDAAPAIIDGLKARGYTLVTVSQLLGTPTPGAVYPR